jgi:hypothetical protein
MDDNSKSCNWQDVCTPTEQVRSEEKFAYLIMENVTNKDIGRLQLYTFYARINQIAIKKLLFCAGRHEYDLAFTELVHLDKRKHTISF